MGSLRQQQISSREEAIIIGTILGDGHLARMKTTARLEVVHSERQKDYVLWKYHELYQFVGAQPHHLTITDPRFKKQFHQWRFKTRGHSYFTALHGQFYTEHGRKIVPQYISHVLTSPLSVAVWFMDDGGRRNDCYGMFLNTLSFSKQEHMLLQQCLQQNFSLETRLHWIQDGYRLYIPSTMAQRFATLVYPYLIPSMRYKLSYNPVTTSFSELNRKRDRVQS